MFLKRKKLSRAKTSTYKVVGYDTYGK